MANAVVGRVLLMPKGNYSADITYNMLDLVRHDNKSWVCKQTCVGQIPQAGDYWQLMASDGAEGGYCYIRYSANADGTGFVVTPTSSTIYIGFYTGDSATAPTNKTAYTWSKYVGLDGNGISSITKTGTSGLTDTYTIAYTNGSTSTYTVVNGADGKGISSITKTGTAGKIDTYTITYTDSTTSTFTITNGNDGTDGLDGNHNYYGTAITGNSTTPTVFSGSGITQANVDDSYTNTTTFYEYRCTLSGNANTAKWVYVGSKRGADGQGSGDMLKSVYDTNNSGVVDNAEKLGNNAPSYYQQATNGQTAETAIEDNDYISFYDTSASGNRKTLWSNIKSVLGNVFAAKSHTHNYAGSSSAGGSATSAVKLGTARNIALTGDVTGTASFDGSANVSIAATVTDDSHNHVISNVDGLQDALNAKQPLTNGLTAETGLADADTVPFYDASNTANRKSTWANIKAVLKTYFDTLYGRTTISDSDGDDITSTQLYETLSSIKTAGDANQLDGQTCGAKAAYEINSNLSELTTVYLTLNTSASDSKIDSTNFEAQYSKVGKSVALTVALKLKTAVSSKSSIILKLNNMKLPTNAAVMDIFFTTSASYAPSAQGLMSANGQITIYADSIPANTWITLYVTYFTA